MNGWRSASSSFRATVVADAPSDSSRSGSSTANSSPPRRATLSEARSTEDRRRGDRAQQRVALMMAERVVDVLEVVEIDEKQADASAVASRGGDRALASIAQKDAVRQAGQRVVQRLVTCERGLSLETSAGAGNHEAAQHQKGDPDSEHREGAGEHGGLVMSQRGQRGLGAGGMCGGHVVDQALDDVHTRQGLLVQRERPRGVAGIDLGEHLVDEPDVASVLREHVVGDGAIRRGTRRTDLMQERDEPGCGLAELLAHRGIGRDLVPPLERFLVRDREPRAIEERALLGGGGGVLRRVARPDRAPGREARHAHQHQRETAEPESPGQAPRGSADPAHRPHVVSSEAPFALYRHADRVTVVDSNRSHVQAAASTGSDRRYRPRMALATREHLLVRIESPAARITLNRPERRNALSLALMEELISALEEAGLDAGGAGDRDRRRGPGLLRGSRSRRR